MKPSEIRNATLDNELLSIVGSGFPDDALIEVMTSTGEVKWLEPVVSRPNWLLASTVREGALPGIAEVRVKHRRHASGAAQAAAQVSQVRSTTPWVHVLYPGVGNDPFTVAFVASPAILSTTGVIKPDPLMSNQAGFWQALASIMHSLLGLPEDLLRMQDLDMRMRWVAVFDPNSPVDNNTALVKEWAGGAYMLARRTQCKSYLAGFGITADIVFAIHGSTTHTYATGESTTDDFTQANSAPYELDGTMKLNGLHPLLPGSIAISVQHHPEPMPLHEFCHAASLYRDAFVQDLHTDQVPSNWFIVDKKLRVTSTDPVPQHFGSFEYAPYNSSLQRWHGVPYPANWVSYHPQQINPDLPDLMDNYDLTSAASQCRLDKLTRDWLFRRLWVKANR